MTLYLYEIGTSALMLAIENVRSYTADSVVTLDQSGSKITYSPLADDCEWSSKEDCSETLPQNWRSRYPSEEKRIDELETLVAELLYGGEDK